MRAPLCPHLQQPEIVGPEEQDEEHVGGGDQDADPQRQPEQQVHGGRRADDLRQVRRRDGHLSRTRRRRLLGVNLQYASGFLLGRRALLYGIISVLVVGRNAKEVSQSIFVASAARCVPPCFTMPCTRRPQVVLSSWSAPSRRHTSMMIHRHTLIQGGYAVRQACARSRSVATPSFSDSACTWNVGHMFSST